MTLSCWRCKQSFDVQNYNLCRVIVPCPTCGTHNAFAECVTRVYGDALGKMAARVIEHAGDAGARRKNADVRAWVTTAWEKLERAVTQARSGQEQSPIGIAA